MERVPKAGPPPRVDGLAIGVHEVSADSPHQGELHPDVDELLYAISGSMTAELHHPDGDEHIAVGAGEGVVIPRGVWHRLLVSEPTRVLHATPGPAFDVRWTREPDIERG